VGDFDGKTAMDLYNAGVPLLAKASKLDKDGSGESLAEIVKGDKSSCGRSLFVRRNVFVCGPILEGEFDRIQHVNDQDQINALHREADRIHLRNLGVDERVIDLPTQFSLWDARTGDLLIKSSRYLPIRIATRTNSAKLSIIHDAIAKSGEYPLRKVSATQAAYSVKYAVDAEPITNASTRIKRINDEAKQYRLKGRWA
jgi:hypothetical protein